MNKFLFQQIKNQRRSNVWIIVELLVVSVVLWYIVDSLYVTYQKSRIPLGFDTEHCYLISIENIDSTSPYFQPDAAKDYIKNHSDLLNRIKQRPEVEAACYVYNGVYPFGFSSNDIHLGYYNESDSLIPTSNLSRQLTTSQYPLVFRLEGSNGETPEQLVQILEQNQLLLTEHAIENEDVKTSQFIGKRIAINEQEPYVLGGVINSLRIWATQLPQEYVIQNASILHTFGNIAFRVRPEMDNDIVKSILDDLNNLVAGDLIISDIQSFEDIRYNAETSERSKTRNFIAVAIFLMVNVFLGLLGTFWFRTQQRVGEIALRKAIGSSDSQILWRIISEGIILLSIATIPAIAIDFAIANYHFTKEFYEYIGWERTGLCILITYLLMLAMIVFGTLFPALKAIRINPAIALKDE